MGDYLLALLLTQELSMHHSNLSFLNNVARVSIVRGNRDTRRLARLAISLHLASGAAGMATFVVVVHSVGRVSQDCGETIIHVCLTLKERGGGGREGWTGGSEGGEREGRKGE